MGKLIDHTDEEGRPYREVDKKAAPEVGVEVRPDAGGNWDVRLTVRRFRFSPAGTAARATAGRGVAHLLVDGRLVGRLRGPEFRLSARLVPRGTHHVTARLYADDGTVWAVAGKPVQSTADITASPPTPTPTSPATTPDLPDAPCPTGAGSARGAPAAPRRFTRPAAPLTSIGPLALPAPLALPGASAVTAATAWDGIACAVFGACEVTAAAPRAPGSGCVSGGPGARVAVS